jgi:6-phosphogluconolactonase (cycloisomerase 2 family)
VLLCAVTVLAVTAVPAAAGSRKAKPKPPPHRAYVQTNDTAGNRVQVFTRSKTGKLKRGKTYSTGGVGSKSIATPFPFTESQGSVTLSRNGRFLFVVNHGSDSVTSFQVTQRGLKRVSVAPSGGIAPLSITISRNGKLAYVVNEGNPATISGFKVGSKGKLSPISNSTRQLAYPAGAPGDIAFNHNGKVLAVSDRMAGPGDAPDYIETFKVGRDGRATALPPTLVTAAQGPFGMEFTASNVLVTTYFGNDQPNQGFVGTHTTSGGALTESTTEATNQTATCWVVITKDQKFAIISNTVSLSLSVYRVSSSGSLTGVNNNPAATGVMGAPTDISLSRDNKFIYALNVDPGLILNDPNARTDIEGFKVSKTGRLTSIGTFGSNMPTTTSGMAAW